MRIVFYAGSMLSTCMMNDEFSQRIACTGSNNDPVNKECACALNPSSLVSPSNNPLCRSRNNLLFFRM